MKGISLLSWFLYLLIPQVIAAQPTDNGILLLLPVDGEIEGWVRDGDLYIATDEGSLSEFINGAAPFYIEHGALEAGFQDYINADVFLTVELYRMGEEAQAEQLLADIHADDPESLDNVHGKGRFVGSYIGVYLIEFRQDTYFVRLNVADKSEVSKKAILTFAATISEHIYQGKNNE